MKVNVERRKGRLTSVLNVTPQAPVQVTYITLLSICNTFFQIKEVIKAPPINTIELCCIDSTVEAKKVKEIYVEESEYQVIRTQEYSYTESTNIEYSR